MKLYRLHTTIGSEYAYIETLGLKDNTKRIVMHCKKVESFTMDNAVIKNKTKKNPDLISQGDVILFASKHLKKILKDNLSKQEINFPEITFNKKPYFLINLIGLRDCMDRKLSKFTQFPNGNVDEITSLVVIKNKIEEIDMFRIPEYPLEIFVTENLKEILETEQCTGIKFSESMDLTVG